MPVLMIRLVQLLRLGTVEIYSLSFTPVPRDTRLAMVVASSPRGRLSPASFATRQTVDKETWNWAAIWNQVRSGFFLM